MIKYIFPSPIYFSKIQNDNSALSINIKKLLTIKSDPLKSGIDGYRIDIDQDLVNNSQLGIGELLEKIQKEIFNYCNQLSIGQQKIIQSWININPTHSYNRKHTHANSTISGAYYINIPADSNSKFVFHRSREFSDYRWNTMSTNDTEELRSELNYLPNTSDLILFPSYLDHEVLPNQSLDDRISISFNAIPV